MKTRVVPVDFRRNSSNELVPVDNDIFTLVTEYCAGNLSAQPKLDDMVKTWAVIDFEDEKPVRVHGVAAYGGCVPDVPLFRVTGENAQRATKMLYDRMNGFFADNGVRGKEVFLYMNEKETEDQRCPAWEESLKSVGAVPAMRLAVTIK